MNTKFQHQYTMEEQFALEKAGFRWSHCEWAKETDKYQTVSKLEGTWTPDGRWTLYTDYGYDHVEEESDEQFTTFSTLKELLKHIS